MVKKSEKPHLKEKQKMGYFYYLKKMFF